MSHDDKKAMLVYLAHASEDKPVVKPLAEGLIRNGIDVWYDNWEIGYFDSLKSKMEQGLGDCTHFIVLLSENSISKPWVNEEIEAAFVRFVAGNVRFIGLRYNLSVTKLTPFLASKLVPEFTPDEKGLAALVAELFGISRKPPLGKRPHYAILEESKSRWTRSAELVAEYFVKNTANAQEHDPISNFKKISEYLSIPMHDVKLGALDLLDAGLLKRKDHIGADSYIWATKTLFAEFDHMYMDWVPSDDAKILAAELLARDAELVEAKSVAEVLQWQPRRFNPAAACLVSAGAVEEKNIIGNQNFEPYCFFIGDKLLRFVKRMSG